MTVSRRAFLASSAAAAVTVAASRTADAAEPGAADAAELGAPSDRADRGARVDPWLEILPSAIEHNVRMLSRLAGGRSILAVAKNNAYGLGLRTAGPILARLREVWGLAVVRADEAFALHDAGVRKPILLMGPATDAQAADLVAGGVRLAAFTDDAAARLGAAARRVRKPATVHLYVDTGMHRMGFPHGRALPWIETLAARKELRIEGVFTELTEDAEFDREQVQRCRALVEAARARGIALGRAHAASSDAIMRPNDATFLDLVRPGITVYGGYPTEESRARGELQSAYRLKARVIRVDNLAPGEGISYHRRWWRHNPRPSRRSPSATWTATRLAL
jgi:alanine racemase